MCRSSRLLAFLYLVVATPAAARMGGVGVPFAPMGVGVQPRVMTGVNPAIAPNVHTGVFPGVRSGVFPNVRSGVNPNVHTGINRGYYTGGQRERFGRFGRRGRFADDGALGGFGDFETADLADDPGLSGADPGTEEYGRPPFFPAALPPRCQHPLIIAIGRGLRHPARTHVVYGAPPRCVP